MTACRLSNQRLCVCRRRWCCGVKAGGCETAGCFRGEHWNTVQHTFPKDFSLSLRFASWCILMVLSLGRCSRLHMQRSAAAKRLRLSESSNICAITVAVMQLLRHCALQLYYYYYYGCLDIDLVPFASSWWRRNPRFGTVMTLSSSSIINTLTHFEAE